MDYETWIKELVECSKECGQSFLLGLERGETQDGPFIDLIDLIEMDVDGLTDDKKGRAIFTACMASAFTVENMQNEIIEKLKNLS
jgi:hypothetical protein